MADIIGRKNAPHDVTDSIQRIDLVKQYTVPRIKHHSQSNEDNKLTLKLLTSQIKLLTSRVIRLEREIESEIAMLVSALEKGETETYDQVKRRISRLKGSLDYPGHE